MNPDNTAYDYASVVMNRAQMDNYQFSGIASKSATADHKLGHVFVLAHHQTSGTIMAQTTYRTVDAPVCRDSRSVNVRWKY